MNVSLARFGKEAPFRLAMRVNNRSKQSTLKVCINGQSNRRYRRKTRTTDPEMLEEIKKEITRLFEAKLLDHADIQSGFQI